MIRQGQRIASDAYGVPWVPGFTSDVSGPALSVAAMKQISYAYAGKRLQGADAAEDVALFGASAANDTGAYLKSAYWMAVAARILGSRALAAQAQSNVAAGNVLLAAPLASFATARIGTILKKAGAIVRQYAGKNVAALDVAARLDGLAAPAAIMARRESSAAQTEQPADNVMVLRDKIMGYWPWALGAVVLGGVGVWWWRRRKG